MQALEFWKAVVADRSDLLARLIGLLDVWAAMDPSRRPSKRQKDLADIARLIEAYPALRVAVPPEILARLL